jgi:hypothetical protein
MPVSDTTPSHSAKLPVEGKEIKERLSSVAGKLLPGHELTLYEIRQSSRRLHPLFQVAMLEPLISFPSTGNFAECAGPEYQLHWIIENARLVRDFQQPR